MLFFLIACASDDTLPDVLDDLDMAVAGVDTVVEDHVSAVTAATTTEEVAATEGDYTTAWTTAHTTLADALDMASQCAMDDADGTSLDASMTAMDAMDAAVTAHTAAGCATLEDCTAAEATHQAEMTGYTDTIRAAGTEWNDGTMECAMAGMSGM